MAFKFNSNQEAADKKRRRKLVATGTGLGALAFGPGRSTLGAALNVAKGVTAAPLGAGYGLLQSAGAVLRGQGTGGVFGEIFEASRALTAPGDIGGGDTPNIKIDEPEVDKPKKSKKKIKPRKPEQLKLKFPKVGMLDLAGAFAPFIKIAIDDKKRKIY